jgi:uncharacterized membrane protein YdjX (TVP38/TMEM64 family)/Fe-S oxidoreductase
MRPATAKAPVLDDGPHQNADADEPYTGDGSRKGTQLTHLVETVAEKCVECGLCLKECRFLTEYGNPKSIAAGYDAQEAAEHSMPFECSLCGLCTGVCPVGADPARMLLEMRRESVRRAGGDYPEHSVILGYEKRGTSRRYTWYAFPRGCDTVFFPGCTLPGTRPGRVRALYDHLKQTVPNLGIVLDCCTKPSHDLGREASFQSAFGEMKAYLLENGIREVLVACSNCHRIFKDNGGELSTRTVYEVLAENGLPGAQNVSGTVTIHDPCGVRWEESIHRAVRDLTGKTGLTVEEMPHHGKKTLCCGEGGSVGFLSPEFSKNWGLKRKEEAQDRRIITYCAGCANFLGKHTPTSHILDLLFEPEATLSGKVKVPRAPLTYWNRIRLKCWFKKSVNAAVTRERTSIPGESAGKASIVPRILMLAVIVGAIAAVRMTGATRFLEQETLRASIEACGIYGPLLYMLVYTIAPALFLPGLPITVVGGILFGPFWGVVYTITSATMGACLAFLVSRYLARDWVERQLRSPRWRRLDEEVHLHGWKVVALTRLIPLFPFNLLNYAFGLTRIKFLHYAAATFACMLPACIAFIVFSSSLLDVIKGRISPAFILGLGLVILVSLIPVFYHRRKK